MNNRFCHMIEAFHVPFLAIFQDFDNTNSGKKHGNCHEKLINPVEMIETIVGRVAGK